MDCSTRIILKVRSELAEMTGAEITDTSDEEWKEAAVQTFYENGKLDT